MAEERYFDVSPEADGWESGYEGWLINRSFYGETESAEAEFLCPRAGFRASIGVNMSFAGGYICRVIPKQGKHLILILRRSLKIVCVEWAELEAAGFSSFTAGTPFRLGIVCGRDTVDGYFNGTRLVSYRRDREDEHFTAGDCGFIAPNGSMQTAKDTFAVKGRKLDPPDLDEGRETPAPYEYRFDPSSLPDGALPAEWTDTEGENSFVIRGGRAVPSEKSYCESLIFEYDSDPRVMARFSCSRAEKDGSFGFILRKAPATAYLRIGYSCSGGVWFAEDVPAKYDCRSSVMTGKPFGIKPGTEYEICIRASGRRLTVDIDGERVLETNGLRHTGFGKTGIFADGADFELLSLEAGFSSGTAPAENAFIRCADPDTFQGSMEIELPGGGEIIGISKKGLYRSADGGRSFAAAPEEYSFLHPRGFYQSVARLHDGTFMQIMLSEGSAVYTSPDLKNWTRIGRVAPDEWLEEIESQVIMSHVGSLNEIRLPDGRYRLFFPMNRNSSRRDTPSLPARGHDTVCSFSDDGGRTWKQSAPVSENLAPFNLRELPDWAESKVVLCDDGTMRLYCSRNNCRFFSFLESKDYGETWGSPKVIPYMQCGLSSFSTIEDPDEPGTWYVAWVNTLPTFRGGTFPRLRLSLARSYDGKNWEFLTDVERFGTRYADGADPDAKPLFQLVDPCVNVDSERVYVSWGESARGSRLQSVPKRVMDDPSTLRIYHNELRPVFASFDKKKLRPQPWSAATVADTRLIPDAGDGEKW
ncbi:MAG: exo-alpha-sialidase [Clostridia bacterium]|nr:exo-alpha-sialidase [Clostridia bacterium]